LLQRGVNPLGDTVLTSTEMICRMASGRRGHKCDLIS